MEYVSPLVLPAGRTAYALQAAGAPVEIAKTHGGNEGKGQIIGLRTFGMSSALSRRSKTAKMGDWQMYYRMYVEHPVVFAAINAKVMTAANTGWEFTARDTGGDERPREKKRLRDFFHGQHDFRTELIGVYLNLEIYGDAFMYVVPDRMGRPSKLKNLPPHTITVNAHPNGDVINYMQWDPNKPSNEPVATFEPIEILHFKYRDPNNDLYGLSILEPLKRVVATDLQASRFNYLFFENGASTGLVISLEDATDPDFDRAKESIMEHYVGINNAHLPMLIGGKVKVHKASPSHTEMNFLKGQEQLWTQMLAVLRVPPSKIGFMENANRSNSKEQDKSFRAESVAPLQHLVEGVINEQFVRRVLGIEHTIWKHSDADTRDAQEQMDLWKDAIQNGILNINEIRIKMGYKTIPGGDVNYVMTPTGAVPVEDMELYFQLPTPNSDKIPESAHEGHNHPRGADGSLRGPASRPTATNADVGEIPASKSVVPTAALIHGASTWMTKAANDPRALRAAYAYAKDAHDATQHPLLAGTVDALRKACASHDDPFLIEAYVERAQGFVSQLVTREDAEGEEDAA